MIVRLFASVVFVCAATAPTLAQSLKSFCAASKASLANDYNLSSAASAVFPQSQFASRDDDCLYPLKVLRYGDADVLLVTSDKPGEACHGCGASMSAYVLDRSPGASHVVARFIDFGSAGTFGDPGRIDAVQLAGHDAFAVEAGGTFQGYTSLGVTFYLFRGRRLIEIKPNLPLSADNGGAATDPSQAISVDGAWRTIPAAPDSIAIDYKVQTRAGKKRSRAVWALKGDGFVLKSGAVPEEYKLAGGG